MGELRKNDSTQDKKHENNNKFKKVFSLEQTRL